MALYLGSSKKLKVHQNGSLIRFNTFTKKPTTNGIRLLSSEGYTLKDSKGLYLTAKESDNNGN